MLDDNGHKVRISSEPFKPSCVVTPCPIEVARIKVFTSSPAPYPQTREHTCLHAHTTCTHNCVCKFTQMKTHVCIFTHTWSLSFSFKLLLLIRVALCPKGMGLWEEFTKDSSLLSEHREVALLFCFALEVTTSKAQTTNTKTRKWQFIPLRKEMVGRRKRQPRTGEKIKLPIWQGLKAKVHEELWVGPGL